MELKPYKGSRDFYPSDSAQQKWMMDTLRKVVNSYAYQEYDGPMLESFELYAAKTGEEIVEQQLYHFEDRGGRKVAIRPEMTPTMARMVAARFQELPKPIRWFSVPNLWRYERPQRGRLREHWQFNVDLLGGEKIWADAEVLSLALDMFNVFEARSFVQLRVNHRGFMDSFLERKLKLDSQAALQLRRLIDRKAKIATEMFESQLINLGLDSEKISLLHRFLESPLAEMDEFAAGPELEYVQDLFEILKSRGFKENLIFDATIMRGADYYTGTVFEAYDVSKDNSRALFGGGRYDNLMDLFGKEALSGIGFGLGDVSLRNFLETHELLISPETAAQIYISCPSEGLFGQAHALATLLRKKGVRVMAPVETGSFKQTLKLANKHGCQFVLLFGEEELNEGKFLLKDLSSGQQEALTTPQLIAKFNQ